MMLPTYQLNDTIIAAKVVQIFIPDQTDGAILSLEVPSETRHLYKQKVSDRWMAQHKPEIGGFFVRDTDNGHAYISEPTLAALCDYEVPPQPPLARL